jgi:hypothetical protein
LTFQVPFGRAGWDLFASIDAGRVVVTPSLTDIRVAAEFSFKRSLLISIVLSIAFGAFTSRDLGLSAGAFVAALVWAWLFGASYAIAGGRVRDRLIQVARGISDREGAA